MPTKEGSLVKMKCVSTLLKSSYKFRSIHNISCNFFVLQIFQTNNKRTYFQNKDKKKEVTSPPKNLILLFPFSYLGNIKERDTEQ